MQKFLSLWARKNAIQEKRSAGSVFSRDGITDRKKNISGILPQSFVKWALRLSLRSTAFVPTEAIMPEKKA